MTYSPKYHQSTSVLISDHKYLSTILLLADFAVAVKAVTEDTPTRELQTYSISFPYHLESVEEKVLNVFDAYCLDGFAPELREAIDKKEIEMSELEYQSHALRFAVNEIYEELKKRG